MLPNLLVIDYSFDTLAAEEAVVRLKPSSNLQRIGPRLQLRGHDALQLMDPAVHAHQRLVLLPRHRHRGHERLLERGGARAHSR